MTLTAPRIKSAAKSEYITHELLEFGLFPVLFGGVFFTGWVGSGIRSRPLLANVGTGNSLVSLLCTDDEGWAVFAVEVFLGCP